MPPLSDDVLRQYEALHHQAGVFALPGRTLIEVTGKERAAFLHSFCTNDVKRLQPGQGCEAFVTSNQGKTLGHVLIFCHEDCIVLESTPGQAGPLIEHFNRFVISEDVEFHDRSQPWGQLLLAGPDANTILGELTAIQPPNEMLRHATVMFGSVAIVWRRAPFVSVPGWLVQMPAGELASVQAAMEGRGAVACSEEVLNMARLEAGWPWFGADITADNLPQEIDRNTQAISFTKGCYLGQETVARLDAMGHVNRVLAGVRLASPDIPPVGLELRLGDKIVGSVTSTGWSPRLNSPLAMSFVRRNAATSGTQLASAVGPAEVISWPMP